MRAIIANLLKKLTTILELFIALMLSIGIILLCLRLAVSLINIPNLEVWPNYNDLLEVCFNLIIGVELIRMVYYHTPNTVFEVLIFAIARQIIIDHSSIWGSLIGVCAIAVLFGTRKYLFCEFDIPDETILRATTRVKIANKLLGIRLPYEDNDTLYDIITRKLEEEETDIGVGACVYYPECGLRVAKMYEGKISRIEVIRAIH